MEILVVGFRVVAPRLSPAKCCRHPASKYKSHVDVAGKAAVCLVCQLAGITNLISSVRWLLVHKSRVMQQILASSKWQERRVESKGRGKCSLSYSIETRLHVQSIVMLLEDRNQGFCCPALIR